MYWSVIGLYAAFVSEVSVRVPQTPFYAMVGIGTGIVMLLGTIFFRIYKRKWKKEFFEKVSLN